MRLFRHSILVACLLLAGSSILVERRTVDRRSALLRALVGTVETVEGCGVWLDNVPAGGRVSWTGKCDFFADGVGHLKVFDRNDFMVESYYGEMRHGSKQGVGLETKNRDRYRGGFAFGQRAGHGEQIIGGVRYEGEFRDGERWGKGTMAWLNRDIYVGQWKRGLPHGYGEVIIGSERVSGQWRRGCLLDSERLAAVATPLDACRGRAAARALPEDMADDDPGPELSVQERGCRGDWFLLCNGLTPK